MKPYLRTTLYYFLFGILWIVLSDHLIQFFTQKPETVLFIQTIKGWLYVAVSAALVYCLTQKTHREQLAAEKEKYAVFRKTVEGAHHILLNYLNQMQLLLLKAEDCPQIEREVLELAHRSTENATSELLKLRDLHNPSPGSIKSVVYSGLKRS